MVGTSAPDEDWEGQAIAFVNTRVNGAPTYYDWGQPLDKPVVERVYDELMRLGVPKYLQTVTSHRKWVRLTYNFLIKMGAQFYHILDNFVARHDLSKYTHREVLGHALADDTPFHWSNLEAEDQQQIGSDDARSAQSLRRQSASFRVLLSSSRRRPNRQDRLRNTMGSRMRKRLPRRERHRHVCASRRDCDG